MMGGRRDKGKAIVLFESQKIRRDWYQDEWWFSVVDVVSILTEQTESLNARKYWDKLAQRLRNEGSEVVTNCHQLKLGRGAPEGHGNLAQGAARHERNPGTTWRHQEKAREAVDGNGVAFSVTRYAGLVRS